MNQKWQKNKVEVIRVWQLHHKKEKKKTESIGGMESGFYWTS